MTSLSVDQQHDHLVSTQVTGDADSDSVDPKRLHLCQ